jgi:hypothetical protein
MENRFQKLCEEGCKGKRANALILEEFQWDNKWVDINAEFVHQDEADVDHSILLCWSQFDEALGATDGLQDLNYSSRAHGGANTSSSEPRRPIGPYITSGRRVQNLIVNDPKLRAELREDMNENGMESDADGNDDTQDKDQDFEVDID